MTIENQLKEKILAEYGSIREFAAKVKLPYSTIDSILKRGICNASIKNIIKICECLGISVDSLANGKIEGFFIPHDNLEENENILNVWYKLNSEGKDKVLIYASDLLDSGKYSNETKGKMA